MRATLKALLLGPFCRRRFVAATGHLVLVVLLTALTQVGAVVWWLAAGVGGLVGEPMARRWGWLVTPGAFAALYVVATVAVVPPLAAALGRPALPCLPSDARPWHANSAAYCLLNRHYAVPAVHRLLDRIAARVAGRHPGSRVTYLDAGFPFLDGFPLPPHLSHDDGRKVDLALFYTGADGAPRPEGGAWPVGYWAFAPVDGLGRRACAGRAGVMRWHMAPLQPRFAGLHLDRARTRALVRVAVAWEAVDRVFLAPRLEKALDVSGPKVRFAGCHAARHDDHLHISVR